MENKSKSNLVNVIIYSAIILGFGFVLFNAIRTNSEYMSFQILASVAVLGWYSYKLFKELSIMISKTDIQETV